MVENELGVPQVVPRIMNPRSGLGIHLMHSPLKIASKSAIRSLAAKMFAREPDGPDLSGYDKFRAY